jgi:hypothetical protein
MKDEMEKCFFQNSSNILKENTYHNGTVRAVKENPSQWYESITGTSHHTGTRAVS